MYAKITWTNTTAPTICSSNLNTLETQYDSAILIGEIKTYTSTTPPTNFWLCDGSAKNKSAYLSLFAITSYKFGGADDLFYLPDLRNKFIVGYGSGDYGTIGGLIGSSSPTLTISQIPSHLHAVSYGAGAGGNLGWNLSWGSNTLHPTNLSTGEASHPNIPQHVVLSYIIRYQ